MELMMRLTLGASSWNGVDPFEKIDIEIIQTSTLRSWDHVVFFRRDLG